MYAFFNKKLDVNRFFDHTVEVGSGPDMPAIESKQSVGETNDEKDDLFEEHLEDALCVFKSGGVNSDILKQNE